MTSENGREDPTRQSARNFDGSYDWGCFQVNDKAHFGTKGWTVFADIKDPVKNAQIALKIYRGRGNWSAWYAVCTPSRQPKKPGIHCN